MHQTWLRLKTGQACSWHNSTCIYIYIPQKYNHHVVLVGFRTTIILLGFFIIIQKGTSIFNMVSDFQGKYIISYVYTHSRAIQHGSGISTHSVQMVFRSKNWHPFPAALSDILPVRSASIILYCKPRKFLRLSRRKQNKTKQTNSNSATSNACIWGLVVMSLHLLGRAFLTNVAWPLMATCCPCCRNLVAGW